MFKVTKDNFLREVNLAASALNGKEIIDIYTNLVFKDGYVHATSGNMVAKVALSDNTKENIISGRDNMFDGSFGLNPSLLSGLINSFNNQEILFEWTEDDNFVEIKSGKTNTTLPVTHGTYDLCFENLEAEKVKAKVLQYIDLDEDFITGLKHSLATSGKNPALPLLMGVYLSANSGKGILYSSDGQGLSKYFLDYGFDKKQKEYQVRLTNEYCLALLKFYSEFDGVPKSLTIYDNNTVEASFGGNCLSLITSVKTKSSDNYLDFNSELSTIMSKIQNKSVSQMAIPEGFINALKRSLLFSKGSYAGKVEISVEEKILSLNYNSIVGEGYDEFELDGNVAEKLTIAIDPEKVLKGAEFAKSVTIAKECIVFLDHPKFMFVIANQDS